MNNFNNKLQENLAVTKNDIADWAHNEVEIMLPCRLFIRKGAVIPRFLLNDKLSFEIQSLCQNRDTHKLCAQAWLEKNESWIGTVF